MTRVLMVSERSLFAQGIEDLLRAEPGIDFAGRQTRAEVLAGGAGQYRPDVILVDCDDREDCLVLKLRSCLRGGTVSRIACVSLDENMVFVLSGEQRALRGVQDLVQAIGQVPAGIEVLRSPDCVVRSAQTQASETKVELL